MIYYRYGHFSLFRTREEAVRLATDWASSPWRMQEPEPSDRLQQCLNAIQEVQIEAEPIYGELQSIGGWSIWSDGLIRPFRICEVYRPGIDGRPCDFLSDRGVAIDLGLVSQAALEFIASCRGSDSPTSEWLGCLRDIREEKELVVGSNRGVWAQRRITRYRLLLEAGEKTVFVFEVGYSEGYAFEVADSWREAKAAFDPPPCPLTECFECGAVFDRPGHVEWGGMGCDRCNT